jgi:hypothetical protein
VTPESSERTEGGDTIRDTDSERVWDKRGLNERSVPWDPPKLLSSEDTLIESNVEQPFSSTMLRKNPRLYMPVMTPSIQRDRYW